MALDKGVTNLLGKRKFFTGLENASQTAFLHLEGEFLRRRGASCVIHRL